MPIYEQPLICCFTEAVGINIPQALDIWVSFGDPFLITDLRPELTKKGEALLTLKRYTKKPVAEVLQTFWTLAQPTKKEKGTADWQAKERMEEKRILTLLEEAKNIGTSELKEKYARADGHKICTCQKLGKFAFWEAQLLTKAQVKAMVKAEARSWEWSFDPVKKLKQNFSHCLLWWRD